MATLSRDEARRESARKGQLRAVAHRKCPKCGRGNAITLDRPPITPGWFGRHCRYCDFSEGQWI